MLPYAPDPTEWTSEQYDLYALVELSLGNREEISEGERADMQVAEEIEQAIDSGDPEWLSKITEYFGDDFNAELDEDMFLEIDAEQRARGE